MDTPGKTSGQRLQDVAPLLVGMIYRANIKTGLRTATRESGVWLDFS